MANLKVELVKSLNSCREDQVATARSLGLRKINSVSEQPDNEATRGKVAKISHLVKVEKA